MKNTLETVFRGNSPMKAVNWKRVGVIYLVCGLALGALLIVARMLVHTASADQAPAPRVPAPVKAPG